MDGVSKTRAKKVAPVILEVEPWRHVARSTSDDDTAVNKGLQINDLRENA